MNLIVVESCSTFMAIRTANSRLIISTFRHCHVQRAPKYCAHAEARSLHRNWRAVQNPSHSFLLSSSSMAFGSILSSLEPVRNISSSSKEPSAFHLTSPPTDENALIRTFNPKSMSSVSRPQLIQFLVFFSLLDYLVVDAFRLFCRCMKVGEQNLDCP